MLNLASKHIWTTPIPVSTGWLLGACMEARGKQELWSRHNPEVLQVLREQAIIQSVESSNRIEGVIVEKERLRPIVLGKSRPRDRPEEELVGYRKSLSWIFSRKRRVPMTPDVILKLHAMAQGGFSGDAGSWKRRDNEIVEILPNGERQIRFVPTTARATPKTVQRLCREYHTSIEEGRAPALLVIATFVFDLLCIHPFRDGNGRVSRLVTTLLLRQHGYEIGRYTSLERLVEEEKEEYYRVLEQCSRGWHAGKNEIIPWWNFFLSILRGAYAQLEHRVESAKSRPAKSALVRQTILTQVEPFTLSELTAQLPSVSPQLIKKVLAELKRQGAVSLEGRGRSARWELIR